MLSRFSKITPIVTDRRFNAITASTINSICQDGDQLLVLKDGTFPKSQSTYNFWRLDPVASYWPLLMSTFLRLRYSRDVDGPK